MCSSATKREFGIAFEPMAILAATSFTFLLRAHLPSVSWPNCESLHLSVSPCLVPKTLAFVNKVAVCECNWLKC